ncbi:putative spermidine/putrescine transport system permease protein [Nocardioides marinisabuli]|uniref:Putative spermidine/putrescine transport system permease protein n=1 Tax=Nocardioides marinisabuli TaxID=419476 RepID=A0A7Y9F1H0_9ACTN|nr:ABC transporter permease [Nocardioides marinisabuli]NYD57596.1 putative spermidine/putrescine transport system permease protein [Nocardioides marinisabuli]
MPDRWALVALPTVAMLLVVFVLPMATIVWRSVTLPEPGLANFTAVLTNPTYRTVLVNTLQMAGLTTVFCVLLGYPYAYLMVKVGDGLRMLLLLCVVVPFWTSLLVRTFAWILLLQDTGLVNEALISAGVVDSPVSLIRTMPGVVIGMVHILLPYYVLPMYAQMRKIDLSLMTAAESLGAPPRRAFWKVFVPLSLPGLISGATLVFLLALGFYVTPALLGSGSTLVIGELIVQQISGVLNWGVGSALAVALLVMTLTLLGVVARFTRGVMDPTTES